MGLRSNQCSSRTLPMCLTASRTAFRVRPRLSQAMPIANPMAPPREAAAKTRPADLFRCVTLPSTPMQVPMAAGTNALQTDSLRYGVRGLPLRNASRPERDPSIPACRTSRPYFASDFNHCCAVIHTSRRPIHISNRIKRFSPFPNLYRTSRFRVISVTRKHSLRTDNNGA